MGSERANTLFYNRYHDQIYLYVLNTYAKCVEDAEEITNDVFLSAFQKMGQLNNYWATQTWLIKIARNASIDFYRNPANQYLLQQDNIEPLDDYDDIEAPVGESALEVLACLEPLDKDCIVLHDLDGFSCKQIAERKGLTVDNVYKIRERAKAKLRKELTS
jgi:RNA polymerase sigma-70 factor (ECF subfamily)